MVRVELGYPFVQRCNLFRCKPSAQTSYLTRKLGFSLAVDCIGFAPSTFGDHTVQLEDVALDLPV